MAKARARLLKYAARQPNGCMTVRVGVTRQGYCRMMVDRDVDLAHRWSYRVFKGPIPHDKLVRHTCDNPPCIEPSHLILGTQSDNINDCVSRGRYVRNRGGAKLSWDSASEIRSRHGSGETQVSLAREYGVLRCTIADIVHGRTWIQ